MQDNNDKTIREKIWHRHKGDEWDAFDQLPAAVRTRLTIHAYDAWAVNVLVLWSRYKKTYGRTARAERALITYLDYCERLEQSAYGHEFSKIHGTTLPHIAASASTQRGT